MMCAKHVDDIKVGAERAQIQRLIKCLEAVFGKLKYNERTFTTIGVRHFHHPDGSVECDQKEYVNAIQTIPPET